VREIEGRPRFRRRLRRRAAAPLVLEIVAHLLGLVGLDRAGVRLGFRHANRNQSIQNRLALDFQFPRQIVDSNFAHPSLFVFPCAVSCSYQPHRTRNPVQLYYP
jgi:hypothetical protein